LLIEIYTFWQNLSTKDFWEEDSMGTTQNPLGWDKLGPGFSGYHAQTQKTSFGNLLDSSSYPASRKAIIKNHLPTSGGKGQFPMGSRMR